jgi:hypothetical protein
MLRLAIIKRGPTWANSSHSFFFALLCFVSACGNRVVTKQPADLVGSPLPRQATSKSKTDRSASALWYRIELSESQITVGIRLYSPPERTKFFLPKRWSEYASDPISITIKTAYGPTGQLHVDLDRAQGVAEVDTKNQEWVDLVYSIPVPQKSDLRTLDLANIKGAIVAYGPTFLVLPSRETLAESSAIPVEVHAPIDWVVESTWKKVHVAPSRVDAARQVQGFLAAGAQELRDSFVVAGQPQRLATKRAADSKVTSLFVGSSFGDRDQRIVHETIIATITEYRDHFGDLGPATVLIGEHLGENPDYVGMGRLGGFVLSIPTEDSVDSSKAALLIAHEALHLWNGHYLVPATSEAHELDWFKEGITHYLAIKTALALGNLTVDEAVEELRQVRHSYEDNPIVSGVGTPTASDKLRFPYDLGVRIGLAFDSHLVSRSGRIRSIHDWLRLLLRGPKVGKKISLTSRSLQNALRTLTTDADDLWQRHIVRRKDFPNEEAFRPLIVTDAAPE